MLKFIDRVERFSKTKQLFFFSLVFLCTVSLGVFLGTFMKFISVTELLARESRLHKEQEMKIQQIVERAEASGESIIIKKEH